MKFKHIRVYFHSVLVTQKSLTTVTLWVTRKEIKDKTVKQALKIPLHEGVQSDLQEVPFD